MSAVETLSSAAPARSIPSGEEMIARARALAPKLRERAVKAERDQLQAIVNGPEWERLDADAADKGAYFALANARATLVDAVRHRERGNDAIRAAGKMIADTRAEREKIRDERNEIGRARAEIDLKERGLRDRIDLATHYRDEMKAGLERVQVALAFSFAVLALAVLALIYATTNADWTLPSL